MTKWEQFEEYLTTYAATGTEFNSKAIAEDLDISGYEASQRIQNYLSAQTAKNSRTAYVLTREGRTSTAMWHVGARASDVRGLGHQTADDFGRRLERFVAPTLRRIGEQNPRAIPAATGVVKAIEVGVGLLVGMLDGGSENGKA